MPEDRLDIYLQSLSGGQGAYLDRIREKAEKDAVPVIRTGMEDLLAVLLALKKPSRILEAGTAVGYSSMFMARQSEAWNGQIDTIEKDAERFRQAQQNVRNSPWNSRIHLILGDTQEVFSDLRGREMKYGLLFLDAAKGQYIHLLPDALQLLETGGVLVSDNVLQDETLLDSRFALERRNRTIHARMREYLYTLTHTRGLVTSIVPVGDGAAVTVRT